MKKEDYIGAALPICMGLGVALGSVFDNLTMGIAFGGMAGVILSICGLFKGKEDEEDKDAE